MRPWLIALSLSGLLGAGAARAQPSGLSLAVEAQLSAGEESDHLSALRQDEVRLFGTDSQNAAAPALGALPLAATSDAPEVHVPEASGSRDLSWLAGMQLPDLPLRWDERVVRYLEYFRDDRRGHGLMAAWLRRSSRYGALIDHSLERAHLPRDLRCVAMAESGFDPTVRSRVGAAGMWQFVRRTGEEYGLTQDHWSDARMDPEASTAAAARYLGQLHRRFGTWELALAAYNMGYGALLRAIRKFNTNDYWVLAHLEAGLPFETTLYVAKILACGVVMRNPERFGFGELTRDPPLDLVRVSVPGGLSLSLLARAARLPREQLQALNPALLRARTPPGAHSWPLRLPRERAASFSARLRRLRPRHPANRAYALRFGESLAMVARRFRTTARALRTLNELENEQNLGPGFALLVPDVSPRPDEAPSERPVVGVPPGDYHLPGKRRIFYRATGHEDAASVARFFSVTRDQLLRWNRIDPNARLTRGLMLQLFVDPAFDLSRAVVMSPDDVRVLTVGSEEFFEWQQQQVGRVRFRYLVAPGDTLSSIGQRFGIGVGSLARINRFSRRRTLHPGDEILIYAERARVPARYLPNPAPSEDAPAPCPTPSADETSADEPSATDDAEGPARP
ncbi:MAG: transglycosylase SLT domain-containing protein [Deltaproteobacteria bacterium]|nr:transglycosylase SLT domain-containing protein [Deltaproteobacteria bacterium]